jgi:hypothetical protein
MVSGLCAQHDDRNLPGRLPAHRPAFAIPWAWFLSLIRPPIGKFSGQEISLPPRTIPLRSPAWISASPWVPCLSGFPAKRPSVRLFRDHLGFTTRSDHPVRNRALPASLLLWRSRRIGRGHGNRGADGGIMPLLGVAAWDSLEAEAPGPSVDKKSPHISPRAKILWLIYWACGAGDHPSSACGMKTFSIPSAIPSFHATGDLPPGSQRGALQVRVIDVVITLFMTRGIEFHPLLQAYFRQSPFRLGRGGPGVSGIFANRVLSIALTCPGTEPFRVSNILRFAGFTVSSIFHHRIRPPGYAQCARASQTLLFVLMFIADARGHGRRLKSSATCSWPRWPSRDEVPPESGGSSHLRGSKAFGKNINYDTAALSCSTFSWLCHHHRRLA